ncbi:MAG: hypothetical protein ACFCGT_27165 [Sandaracinaceae bacterium]
MERSRIRHWLASRHRTWRWLPDPEDADRYQAVRTTDRGLLWYAWSHLPGEDGPHDEAEQSYPAFRAEGPLRPLPAEAEAELRAWVSDHAPDPGRAS